MNIDITCLKEIEDYFKIPIPEKGGIMGGRCGIITCFKADIIEFKKERNQYIPNVEFLNCIIKEWYKKEIEFYGIIHSHPEGQNRLSSGDRIYIQKILINMPNHIKKLYFPIALGNKNMVCYSAGIVDGNVEIISETMKIIRKGGEKQ